MTSLNFIKKSLPRRVYVYFLLAFVSITVGILLNDSRASAAYDGGRIIDNSVFLNANSMSKADIQNFLAGKGAGLANLSFVLDCDVAGEQAKQIYLSIGAPCGQNTPASHIIFYAAQIYGINPQVVLATMQKEQSLTTAANPTSWQLEHAMGYGCPTSGGCSASTFFYQIDNGTWVLRFHYERARGNMSWWYTSTSWTCGTQKAYYKPNLYPNQNVNFYDQDGVYYRTHFIANAATSAFYCYTPHAFNNHRNGVPAQNVPAGTLCYSVHPEFGNTGRCYTGSYNFVKFFELWFGSTSGSLLIPHPDGTLVRPANSPRVYLLKDGGAVYGTSAAVLRSWGFDLGRLKIATAGDLNLLAQADNDPQTYKPLQFREGALVKGTSPTVYVIQNVNGTNQKRSLETFENFTRLNYSFSEVISVPDNELPADTGSPYGESIGVHPNNSIIKAADSPNIYIIINGERHSMTSPEIFVSHRFSFSAVKLATEADMQLPLSWPVTWLGEGMLIKGSGPEVYITDLDVLGIGSSKRYLGSYYNFVGLGYTFPEVVHVSDNVLPTSNGPTIGE